MDSLKHYGIIGMRWGHRKDRSYGKRYNKKKSKKYYKRQNKRKQKLMSDPNKLRKNMNKFSTKELEDAVKRIELDYKLQELGFKKINKGKKYVDTVIGYGKTGKDIYDLYNSKAGRAAKKRIQKAFEESAKRGR